MDVLKDQDLVGIFLVDAGQPEGDVQAVPLGLLQDLLIGLTLLGDLRGHTVIAMGAPVGSG